MIAAPHKPTMLFGAEDLDAMRPRLPEYLAASGVELRRQGSRFIGRCPIHDDRSPSFAVFGARHEVCGCHPCGFTGDVFDAAQWMGRAGDFKEAVSHVAGVLGVYLPEPGGNTPRAAKRVVSAMQRQERRLAVPFTLTDAERDEIHRARLAFSDAFHGGDEIVDRIADSLGLERETLRHASWGSCGLGIASPDGKRPYWLCYAYATGLKWRNPDPESKPRFQWIVGKATAPWRMEWVKPETETIYLTEGESDALAIIEAGIEDDGTAVAVASPGTSFPREWAPMFTGKRVVICFDRDEAGQAATKNVAVLLKEHAREVQQWRGIQ